MDILKHALNVEGSVGKLADALGVRPNVVSNWKLSSRTLPKPWQIALQLKYGKRKAPEEKQAA